MSQCKQHESRNRARSASPARKLRRRCETGSSLSSDRSDLSNEQARPHHRPRKRERVSSEMSEESSSLTSYNDGTESDTQEHGTTLQSEYDETSMSITHRQSSPAPTKSRKQYKKTRSGAFPPRRDTDASPAIYYGIKSPPVLPQPMGDFLEIYHTPDRGRGVRTTMDDIPQGTILFSEQAAIHVPSYHNEYESDFNNRVRAKVAALKPSDLTSFISLSHDGNSDTEEARFARNCFEDRDPESEWFAGMEQTAKEELEGVYNIWLDMAMLNHSCRPNAIMLIRDSQAMIADLIATVDLPVKGTEVTISYLREADAEVKELGREERRAMLMRSWRFGCECEACGKQDSLLASLAPAHDNPDDGDVRNGSIVTEASSFEDSDSRLDYLHDIGEQLGIIRDSRGRLAQPTIETFTRLAPGYEAVLKEERMVYRLYALHEKAIQVYTTHYCETGGDEVTQARILHHREQLNRYSRICYSAEEAQKSAMRYVKDLKGKIAKSRVLRDESAMEAKGVKRKRQPPTKPASTSQMVTRSKRAAVSVREVSPMKETSKPGHGHLDQAEHPNLQNREALSREETHSNDLEVIQHFRRHRRPVLPGRPRHTNTKGTDTAPNPASCHRPNRSQVSFTRQPSGLRPDDTTTRKALNQPSRSDQVRTTRQDGAQGVRCARNEGHPQPRLSMHKEGGTLTDPIDLS